MTACEIPMPDAIEGKQVKVSVRDAGFYETLDALCREHGEVTYFRPRSLSLGGPELRLWPVDWINYPTCYADHFKIIVSHVLRTRQHSGDSEGKWANLGLVVFSPPWLDVTLLAGTKVKWSLDEIKDRDGKDLTFNDEVALTRLCVDVQGEENSRSGNLRSWSARVQDFDPCKGLRILSGKIQLDVAESTLVRVPAEVGQSVEIPSGTLTIDSVLEHEKGITGSRWRIAVSFKPTKVDSRVGPGLASVLESRVRYDGREKEWDYIEVRLKRSSFEVMTQPLDHAPAWFELRVRDRERHIEVPFKFQDIAIKKG
jgi:hypothetical protein